MAERDFYQVLGVARSASDDEIRRAYRKLARELHPDVNKAADAAKRFDELQKAYDTLADAEKRKSYDQYGSAGPGPRWGAGGAGPRSAAPGGRRSAAPDFDIENEDLGSVFEAIFGDSGRGRKAGSRRGRAAPRPEEPAEPIRHEIRIPFMTGATGGTEHLRISENGKARTIEVRIPPGITDGGQLRVRGATGGQDLVLTVKIDPHPLFRRGEFEDAGKGLDIYLDLPITIVEAVEGALVLVPTLEQPVELKLPPGTSSGKKLRLRGRGIADRAGNAGDLYAVVRIVAPAADELTPDERDVLQRLVKRSAAVRAGPEWPQSTPR